MAHYQVTRSRAVKFEPRKYFKTRPPADRRFVEMANGGGFVQMIEWDDHKARVISSTAKKKTRSASH